MTTTTKELFQGLKEMPSQKDAFIIDWKFNSKEWENVKEGFASSCMDEKWNIYLDNNKLYFHRSWTGTCIYIAHLQELPNSEGAITKVEVNRNPNEYKNTNIEEDKTLFKKVVQFQLIDFESSVKKLIISDSMFSFIRYLIPEEYLQSNFTCYKEYRANLLSTWSGYLCSEYIDMAKTKGIEETVQNLKLFDMEYVSVITCSHSTKMLFLITDETYQKKYRCNRIFRKSAHERMN